MTDDRQTREGLLLFRELRGLLQFHQQIGLDFYPFVLPGPMEHQAGQVGGKKAAPASITLPSRIRIPTEAVKKGYSLILAELDSAIADCRRCPRGIEGVVTLAGEGKTGADLFIVVEQSILTAAQIGNLLDEEDRALLAKMLAAIKISTNMVYMAPLVKCASAAGLRTTREERAACLPFLEQQIASLRPRAILVFGEGAAQALLRSEQPLFYLRGKVEVVQGIPLLATYHPAQLRLEPALKQMAWQDLQLLQKVMAGRKT